MEGESLFNDATAIVLFQGAGPRGLLGAADQAAPVAEGARLRTPKHGVLRILPCLGLDRLHIW